MKDGKVKSIKQKIIISILIVILMFTFIMPTYSQADFGGALIDPICDLLKSLGDVINRDIGVAVGTGDAVLGPAVNKTGRAAAIAALTDEKVDVTNASALINYCKNNLKLGDRVKTIRVIGRNEAIPTDVDGYLRGEDDVIVPNIRVTPYEIFSGKIALLDPDFFTDTTTKEYKEKMIGAGDPSNPNDNGKAIVAYLKKTVSNWYQGLRLIAIVGLLSVLVYVGIRIVTSAVASDKAKYKQMFMDWVIALCLIFFLHYIMIFTITMVKEIQKLFVQDYNGFVVYVNVVDGQGNTVEITESHWEDNPTTNKGTIGNWGHMVTNTLGVAVFPTNLTGYERVLAENPDGWPKFTYTVMYLALTFYTVYFMFIYFKRVIILTLLTIMAPLVALTYPIDKVKDSRAQAFEFWIREYIVNSLLPIIHLILYTVLVTSAIDLVVESPLYAVAVLAFIVPAEKLIKSMFGIRSETAPALGSFAGGALAVKALQSLGKGKDKNKEKDKGGSNKIRTKDKAITDPNIVEGDGLGALAGGSAVAIGTESGRQNDDSPTLNLNDGTEPANLNANGVPELQDDELFGFGREYSDNELESLGANSIPSLQDAEDGLPIADSNIPDIDVSDVSVGDTESNFTKYLREKYDIPVGETGKTLLKRAAIGAGKVALRGSTLIGGAAIGLAGGIVGGDMHDMWKGAMLGGYAGNAIGRKVSNGVGSTVRSIDEAYNQIYYGKTEAQNMQADAEFMHDVGNRQHVADRIMKSNPDMKRAERNKEIEKRMQEYAQYRRTGISDIREMDRLYEIREGQTAEVRSRLKAAQEARDKALQDSLKEQLKRQEASAQKYAIEVANLSTHYSADTFRDAGKADKAQEALARRFRDRGLSKEKADAAASRAMRQVRRVKGE